MDDGCAHFAPWNATSTARNMGGHNTHPGSRRCALHSVEMNATCGGRAGYSAVGAVRRSDGRRVCAFRAMEDRGIQGGERNTGGRHTTHREAEYGGICEATAALD